MAAAVDTMTLGYFGGYYRYRLSMSWFEFSKDGDTHQRKTFDERAREAGEETRVLGSS